MKNTLIKILAFPVGLALPVYKAASIVKQSENMALTTSAVLWGALAGGCLTAGLIYILVVKKMENEKTNRSQ